MNFINIENVSKIYSVNDKEFFALNNLSLEIPSNQNTVIIGKSGSGKTTLLNIINGLTPLSKGKLTIPPHIKISTVFQEHRLLPWLTVEKNSTFWNPLADPTTLLKELDLFPFKDLYPHEISGGMAQKTALIRALLYDTNFLLLDEPFASLDYFMRIQLQEKLLQLTNKLSIGMIFITHNVDKAILLGDNIIILDQGKLKTFISNHVPHSERSNTPYSISLKTKIFEIINNTNKIH